MTAEEFNAWLDHMNISGLEASRKLGAGKDTITNWKRNGAPHYIGLACAALAFGLPAWKQVKGD